MNTRPTESYLRDVLPENPTSVLDVGVGDSGIFDFAEWEKRKLIKKTCTDLSFIREDIPDTWKKIICDGTSLPFEDNEYDVVQCCEVIDYVPPDKWDQFVNELCRVSKDLIYLSTRNFPGGKQFFIDHKFHILFVDHNTIFAFKRKIPTWNLYFYDIIDYIKSIDAFEDIHSIIDVSIKIKGCDYYDKDICIKKGYAYSHNTLKDVVLQHLNINILNILDILGQRSFDIVQALVFLEYLEKSDVFKFLYIAEKIAKKAVIISAPSFINKNSNEECDFSSIWHWKEFEKLGYYSNFEHMRKGLSFSDRVIAWKILKN